MSLSFSYEVTRCWECPYLSNPEGNSLFCSKAHTLDEGIALFEDNMEELTETCPEV